jgi:hypothetical protein
MDLRVAPSARTANSLLFLPPFPPAAERWAFTWVESIICMSADRPFPQPKQVLAHVPDAPNESTPYGIRIALPPQQN